VANGELYATCWATISYRDHFGFWHLTIEPFCYDAETHTFDRHPIGYKEAADRRYGTYQQRAQAMVPRLDKAIPTKNRPVRARIAELASDQIATGSALVTCQLHPRLQTYPGESDTQPFHRQLGMSSAGGIRLPT